MKILPINNYQMQNQNKKQDVNFGVGVSKRTITKMQQLIAENSLQGSHELAGRLQILLKLQDEVISDIDFVPKGGLLLNWTPESDRLASTVEMPLTGTNLERNSNVATFFKNLLDSPDPEAMKKYLQKVAAQYFPADIAVVRLKFPSCRDDGYQQRVLAQFERLKRGESVENETLRKWREGAEDDIYGNSNSLV